MNQKYIVEVDSTGNIVGQEVYTPQAQIQTSTTQPFAEIQALAGPIVAVSVGLLLVAMSVKIVRHQSAKVIERLGKFKRILRPGINFTIPFIDRVAGNVDLRISESAFEVETKTKDNVFVRVVVRLQLAVSPDREADAFYKLTNPRAQIGSYVFDLVRSTVPDLTLDEAFARKEEVALRVKNELSETMTGYGYTIITALVTDIEPDQKVKAAMNEINASQRLRVAASENAEAEKFIEIKKAEATAAARRLEGEAEAEFKKSQGRGIAEQRKEIIQGLKNSVQDMAEVVNGASADEIFSMVLLTQYIDALKEIGQGGRASTIFMDHTPSGLNDLKRSILGAMKGNE